MPEMRKNASNRRRVGQQHDETINTDPSLPSAANRTPTPEYSRDRNASLHHRRPLRGHLRGEALCLIFGIVAR